MAKIVSSGNNIWGPSEKGEKAPPSQPESALNDGGGLFLKVVDKNLLNDSQKVEDCPVEDEPGGHFPENEDHYHRHNVNHSGLFGIFHGHLLLDQHGYCHEKRQDMKAKPGDKYLLG